MCLSLAVSNSTLPGRSVRLYAQCTRSSGSGLTTQYAPGSVLVIAFNLDNTTSTELALSDARSGAALPLSPRDEYRLSGPLPPPLPGSDTSCFFAPGYGPILPYLPSAICLNGELLYLRDGPAGPNSTLPFLNATVVTDGTPILLQPLSAAMFVLTGVNAAACQ